MVLVQTETKSNLVEQVYKQKVFKGIIAETGSKPPWWRYKQPKPVSTRKPKVKVHPEADIYVICDSKPSAVNGGQWICKGPWECIASDVNYYMRTSISIGFRIETGFDWFSIWDLADTVLVQYNI